MDIGNILIFLLWLYILYSFLGRGRKKKPDQNHDQEQADVLYDEETSVQKEPVEVQSQEQKKTAYDYDSFRERLRHSWGLPDDTAPEENVPETATEPLSSVEKEQPGKVGNVRLEVPEQNLHVAEDHVISMQSYFKSTGVTMGEQVPLGLKNVEFPLRVDKRSWSENDVRQWAVYAAIFGEPRSRIPWRPVHHRLS